MNLPNDPLLLMSVVNTKLQDYYADLDALCDDLSVDRAALEEKLAAVGYYYDGQRNQFNLENIRTANENWKVQLTELEFKKRLFEEE